MIAWILREIYSQTAVLVVKLKSSVRNIAFRAFQCEVELDYISVSRLLLVPVGKCLRQ